MLRKIDNRLIFVLLLTVAALLFVACTPNPVEPGAPAAASAGGITVVGRGEASGRPDEAEVQLGVDTFAETVAEATASNEATIQGLMSALEAQGVAAEDIQTSNYSVWPEQRHGENGPEGIVGYRVNNQVTVTLHDIEQVGDVIAAATEAGANNVQGVYFTVADPQALEGTAREEAIADARQRAASLAELSGVELGEVIAVSEVIGQPVPYAVAGMGGGMAMDERQAPSISPGQFNYNVQVQVTFAIQ